MTLRLILTRHAKSSWDDPVMDDHDRPLNTRGRLSASAVGSWLASRGYVPDQIICSTSARTRETCELLVEKLEAHGDIKLDHALYHATPEQILDVLRGATGQTVMMVGHNPGFAYAAAAFAAVPPVHPRFGVYPTAATTVYDFDVSSWDQVIWGSGQVLDFVVPRDLGVD
jgi:phosphohistidine phosphatase